MKTTYGNRLLLLFAAMTFVLGVVCWGLLLTIPRWDYGADQGFTLWEAASVLGVLGAVCSFISLVRKSDRRSLTLLIANLVMIVSPFLMWTIGTAIWGP